MGYQDAISSIGIHTNTDNKPSNGTVDGIDSFDTKGYPSVDPATRPEITATDESPKYAGNVSAWSQTDAYGNSGYARDVARYLFIGNRVGINTVAGEEQTKRMYMERGMGASLFTLG